MKVTITIGRKTTPSELLTIVAFSETLAYLREGHVVSGSADVVEPEEEAKIDAAAGVMEPEKPKRKRRTKAEMEAAAPEAPAPEPEPEQEPATEAPAPTPPAPETTSGAAETPVTASPSEVPIISTADLNLRAATLAKKIGPERVKAKITEFGAPMISALNAEQRVALNAWITEQLEAA